MIHKLGFLSIEQRYNSGNYQDENFYFISDNNFNNIFRHICTKARVEFNPDTYELAFKDRDNIYPILDEKMNIKLDFDDSLQKEHLLSILNQNLAFFFLFIMQIGLKLKHNKYFDELTTALSRDFSFNEDDLFIFGRYAG